MTATAAREIELKLLAADADLERLARWAAARWRLLAPIEAARVVTDYYDAPDLALAAAGVAVRLRQDGERRLLTIKAQGAQPGDGGGPAATRREWEIPVDDGLFQPADIDRAGAGELIPAALRPHLRPCFQTTVARTRLLLAPYDGAVVEMALDHGRARAGDVTAPISEIELELRQGPLRALFDVALDLADRAALRVGAVSKADLGLRLLTGRKPQAAAAPPLGLSRLLTGEEALRHRARAAVRHLTANLPAAELADGAAFARMREALARLRPAFDPLGKAPANNPAIEKLLADRRWLAERLAPCPAWDALALRLTQGGAEEVLRRAAADMRADAATATLRTLRSPRLTGFILTAARQAEERLAADPALAALLDGSAAALAAAELDRLAAGAAKRLRRFADGDPGAAASLGKRLRRLRREMEACRGLFATAAADAWAMELAELAAALGRRAAAARARRLLRVIAREHRDAHAAALTWARFMAAEERQALAEAQDCARALPWPSPFWRDGTTGSAAATR